MTRTQVQPAVPAAAPTWRPWRRGRRAILVVVAAVAVPAGWPALSRLPADTNSGHWEAQAPLLLLGVIVGLTYGLLGAGLVIVYRTSRIINFAHGNIGAFAAAMLGLGVVRWHLPYWVAFVLALAVGGGAAAATEALVVRRLRNAPRLMSIVATLGVGQFLVLFAFAANSQVGSGNVYPQPSGMADFMFGGLRVSPAFSGMLILSPVVLIALAGFLKYSRLGIGIRSASENPEAARMAGIFASRMTSLAWALSGVLAALTAVLTQPTRGFTTAESFGPSLLLMALAAGALARMTSIPVSVIGGLGLGLLEQLLRWNYPGGASVEIALFGVILVALLLQRQRGAREEEKTSWATVEAVRPLPDELHAVWTVRNLGRLVAAAGLAVAVVLPLIVSPSSAVQLTVIFAYAVVALSLAVVTGLGGQLTLGQFAFAAVGAVVSYHVAIRTGWYLLAFCYAGAAAGLASLIVGVPALRIRGLLATVTTLAFALAVPGALGYSWLLGTGVDPGRPILFGRPFDTGREYYYVGLAVLVLALVLVRNVRNSGFGRTLVAVRDNEDAARAFTVRATATKLQAFMLAGFIAGLGGAMYGHTLSLINQTTFPATASIDVAKVAVIGGISTLAGPVIGALFVMGVPAFVPLDAAGLAATSFGQLLILMYLPRGLVQLVVPARDRIARFVGARAGVDVAVAFARRDAQSTHDEATGDETPRPTVAVEGLSPMSPMMARRNGTRPTVLRVADLHKSFGGIRAVDGVSLDVRAGETVGLIGPNGAGKTTTFELVGGFVRPDHGTVAFNERNVTSLSPEARGRMGLIRSFQDAALFPTMTVEEAVMLACERVEPTSMFQSLAGIRSAEERKRRRARAVVASIGLERYRRKPIMELSTGTRRIAELACLIALEPVLLLLDEPSSGIAQRESEALGTLLRDLKRDLGMTLVIIEHDIPLIMDLADRIIVMADGKVLTEGSPQDVRRDQRVADAYLGSNITAIDRSGELQPSPSEPAHSATTCRR